MAGQRTGKSRRNVIRALAGAIPAGFSLRSFPACASEEMTRQQAEYQDKPKGIYMHAVRQAQPLQGRRRSEDGWCKTFAMAHEVVDGR
jgi:hypothetical protein